MIFCLDINQKIEGACVSNDNDFAAAKNICNQIGGAVLEVLGEQREFTVQSLIDVLKEAGQDGYHDDQEREKAIERAIRLLEKFT